METGDLDGWPTIPGWAWWEACGGPSGEPVPFARLSYVRGIDAVRFSLPRADPRLLLQWWTAVNQSPQPSNSPAWVPVWVWLEEDDEERLTCVSLDRVDVPPRELLMPTSARGLTAVRNAVAEALIRYSGEATVPEAIAAMEAGGSRQPGGDGEYDEPPATAVVPQDAVWPETEAALEDEEAAVHEWPTLPVWVWLETDGEDDWRPRARLSPTGDIAPVQAQVPASGAALSQLWFLARKATTERTIGRPHARTIPAWLWVEAEQGEHFVWFSFERVAGVRSTPLELPEDERQLAVMRDRIGTALVWLTGCETPGAAAAHYSQSVRQLSSAPKSAKRNSDKPSPKRRKHPVGSERKMVIPRIRIVSGGLPGLGRRR